MKNEFTQETRDIFFGQGWSMSWETGINDADCIHHIMGRCSSSPYNAAPLNNRKDHMPEGRKNLLSLSSFEIRSKYLKKTKKYLDDIGYKPNSIDIIFLEKNSKYYK